MALPTKGSRKIVVDSHTYRWIIRKGDTATTLTVASAEFNGQTMIACFDRFTKNIYGSQYFVVTPYIVRQSILYGLENGWKPMQSGGQIHLRNLSSKLETTSTGERKTKKLVQLLRGKNEASATKSEELEGSLLQCENFLKYGEWFVGLEMLLSDELAECNFEISDEMFILIDEIIDAASQNLEDSKRVLAQSVRKMKRAAAKRKKD